MDRKGGVTIDKELRNALINKAADIYEEKVIPHDDCDLENNQGNDYTIQDALSEAANELNIVDFEDKYDDEYNGFLEELIKILGI